MWTNAQRDCRPAENRWRPLFSAAKFGWHPLWRPLLECHAVMLPRRETHWNWHGCLKLANGSQPLVGWSSPYYQDMWRRYCCLTSFYPIVDTCLSSEDIARQIRTKANVYTLYTVPSVSRYNLMRYFFVTERVSDEAGCSGEKLYITAASN